MGNDVFIVAYQILVKEVQTEDQSTSLFFAPHPKECVQAEVPYTADQIHMLGLIKYHEYTYFGPC